MPDPTCACRPNIISHAPALALFRVVKGMDVAQLIERVKVDKHDKPSEDIKIVNIDVLDQSPGEGRG